MAFDLAGLIQVIALAAIPIIFAITLHEAAHGYAARHFGDYTAYNAGRISLNPLRHIDPVGTIAVPLLILVTSKLLGTGGILFGWAKPVPVNFGQLRHPKRDMLWVAAAGPGANLVDGAVLGLRAQAGAGHAGQLFLAADAADGAVRHRHQRRADGAEPVAVAAAGRRTHRRQPAAGAAGLALREDRAVWLYNPADAAVHWCSRRACCRPSSGQRCG